MSGWLVENNTFIDCQTAMLLGGGRDATIQNNKIESCALGLAFEYALNSRMNRLASCHLTF